MKRIFILMIFVALVSLATNAHALTFEGDVIGSWTNVVKDWNDYTAINNNDQGSAANFYFGLPATYNTTYSRFSFNGSGSDPQTPNWVGQDDGSAFLIGDFCYFNGVNTSYSVDGVHGVDLSLNIQITDPISLLNQTFNYDVGINTTHNITGNPYLDRDFVTVATSPWSTTFMYNTTEYTLEILGFSTNQGASFVTDLSASENGYRHAGLYASVTSSEPPNPIPEPTSIFLMGSGLLGILGFKRKK